MRGRSADLIGGDENARGSWGERFSRRAVGARTMRMRISCLPTRRPRAFAKTPPMVASGVCGVVLCAALGCLRGGSGRVRLGRLASGRVILKNVMRMARPWTQPTAARVEMKCGILCLV